MTEPEVDHGGQHFRRTEPGWRDALCALSDHRVTDASFPEHVEFRIEFDDDSVFAISLRDSDRSGAEAVVVSGLGVWVL